MGWSRRRWGGVGGDRVELEGIGWSRREWGGVGRDGVE